MLVPAQVGIAVRCPHCGQLEIQSLSMFALSGVSGRSMTCRCGQSHAQVSRQRGRVVFRLPCFLCGGTHHFSFPAGVFWSGQLLPLICPSSDLHAGVIGEAQAVRTFLGPQADGEDGAGEEDFFVNPEVMYEVLAAVHELDESGRLRCRCGNHDIEYELKPDRLELVCGECGTRQALTAVSEADAARARRTVQLEIGGSRGHRGG